jgi:hypothetical protein
MMTSNLPSKAVHLREQHPSFRYESFRVTSTNNSLELQYHFSIAPEISFKPTLNLPLMQSGSGERLAADPLVNRLVFLIGMVELLSYWKTCCSPTIEVAAGPLSQNELVFWERLIRNGLGEFFYTNQISPNIDFTIRANPGEEVAGHSGDGLLSTNPDSVMVLVGGGKDSILTLELLREYASGRKMDLTAFALNPITASLNSIQAAGYSPPLIATRQIDPLLRDLNSRGYLNGHTPFSALLAFVSSLVAYINGHRYVLASNEASASEGNVKFHEIDINHQYSKSFEFESLFREYARNSRIPVEYLSFLRPVNELQICALFSDIPDQHLVFRSCNREQTLAARNRAKNGGASGSAPNRSGWCADCPKCVFTYLCLSCFLPQSELIEIFGADPSAQANFSNLVAELAGLSEHKPFECVGTYEEVLACLRYLSDNSLPRRETALAFKALLSSSSIKDSKNISELLSAWNNKHFLPSSLEKVLKDALSRIRLAS